MGKAPQSKSPLYDGNRLCHSEDVMVFICHVILQDLVIEVSCDFMKRSSSRKVTNLASLLTVDIKVGEI